MSFMGSYGFSDRLCYFDNLVKFIGCRTWFSTFSSYYILKDLKKFLQILEFCEIGFVGKCVTERNICL